MDALLNKDQEARGTIIEICEMPSVRKQIDIFVAEKNCLSEVLGILPDQASLNQMADNEATQWKAEVGEPHAVSVKLVNMVTEVYKQTMADDDTLDVQKALESDQYEQYIQACAELQKINIEQLNHTKRIAFFLNIYQCMYVHYFLLKVKDEDITSKEELPGVISI